MALSSRKIIQGLLQQYKIQPSKRLGQNFLIDSRVISQIIEAADLKESDTVLEIGPGIGNLTQELAKRAKKVIAVEKDPKMCEILKELLDCWIVGNVEIVKGDILKLEPKTYLPARAFGSGRWQAGNLKPKTYKIVANLPFYLTSPAIRKFLELNEVQPQSMILMVQKEVAQRICACPPKLKERRRAKPLRLRQGYGGQAKMNLLAVSVQFYAEPKIISYVSKKSFWPRPEVDGAIIKIIPRKSGPSIRVNPLLFFKIVKAGFSQPRKQLINNLSKKLGMGKIKIEKWLLQNNIQPSQRAETLSVKDWIELTKNCPEYVQKI